MAQVASWREQAACIGKTEVFYPVAARGCGAEAYDAARLICRTCPVIGECLEDALATSDVRDGFRGGMTPSQRAHARAGRPRPKRGPRFLAYPDAASGHCKGCGQAVTRPEAESCSEKCRKRLQRARQAAA